METKTSSESMTKTGLYVGTGAGIILFALAGLLPGSFIGGIIGLQISNMLFGAPMAASIIPRLIVAASMIMGVMVSAVVFVLGTGVLGWSVGYVADLARSAKTSEVAHETGKA